MKKNKILRVGNGAVFLSGGLGPLRIGVARQLVT